MPYYGPRFIPTAPRNVGDELADMLAAGARGYTLGRAVKQEQEDRAELKRQRERREGFEDWERGVVPESEAPAPRARAEYEATPVPSDTLTALERGRGGVTVGDFLGVDEGFSLPAPRSVDPGLSPTFPQAGPPMRDTGFERPGPDQAASIADFLGDEPLRSIQPRQHPGMDPYTVAGRTYDPELPLRRGLATRQAELTLADVLDEAADERRYRRGLGREEEAFALKRQREDEAYEREVARLVAAGVPEARARAEAGRPDLIERELFRDQFRTSWPVGGGTPRQPTLPSYDAATRAIYQAFGKWNPATDGYDPLPQDWLLAAIEHLRTGGSLKDLPPLPDAADFFLRAGRSMREPGWSVRGAAATASHRVGAQTAPGASRGAGSDVFRASGQRMLADEWEQLVDAGWEPDEATAEIERRYNVGARR